jgi:HJR/Mrr/RecB family endonuclease
MLYTLSKIDEIDNVAGSEFERFVARLFLAMGYDVQLVSSGADQGADLIVQKKKEPEKPSKIAIQAKRYKQPVGNAAVQELLGGMTYHGCKQGIVVTSSTFTRSARALASKDRRIELWDRTKLVDLYKRFLAKPPEFSMQEYTRLKNSIRSVLLKPKTGRRMPQGRMR